MYYRNKGYLIDVAPKLSNEWHPYKNGNKTPYNTTIGHRKKVWWYLRYYDEKTGFHDFEWESRIADRIKSPGCPFLSGRGVWRGFNDLATLDKEIASYWHPSKNNELTPEMVTIQSGKKVWWQMCVINDNNVETKLEWEERISDFVRRRTCPYLSSANTKTLKGFNDLETLRPDLAKEWHPDKNGTLMPCDVTLKSNRRVWWKAKYISPITNIIFDVEWQARISDRVNYGNNCHEMAKRLRTSFPEQAIFYYVKQVFPESLNAYSDIFKGNMSLDIYIYLKYLLELNMMENIGTKEVSVLILTKENT